MTPRERFLKACRREPVDRPPVWMMRQAGRYLPEYREIRQGRTTLQMMKDPKLACEITLQPVRRLKVDAAILYSDILILPEAMGLKLDFVKDVGPVFDHRIHTVSEVEELNEKDVTLRCPFVFETIELLKEQLPKDYPLLGFAGAPFTVASYMAGGDGAYDGNRLKQLIHENPNAFHQLMDKLTSATVQYLTKQVETGADAIQLFDTWAGTLSADDYERYALPYTKEILGSIRAMGTPAILYIKGGGHLFDKMILSGPDVVSVDWRLPLSEAKRLAAGRVAIQGNFDPARLYDSPAKIEESVASMIRDWGQGPGYIVNLGHGILEDIPVPHAHAFVEAAKKYGPRTGS